MNEAAQVGALQRAARGNGFGKKPGWLSAILIYAVVVGVAAAVFYVVQVRGNEARLNRLALRSLQSLPNYLEHYIPALQTAISLTLGPTAQARLPFLAPLESTTASSGGLNEQSPAQTRFKNYFPVFAASAPLQNTELYFYNKDCEREKALKRIRNIWYLVIRERLDTISTKCAELRTPLEDLLLAPDALNDFDQILLASPDGEILYRSSRGGPPTRDVWLGLRRFRDEFSSFVAVDTAPRDLSKSPATNSTAASMRPGSALLDPTKLAELQLNTPREAVLESTESVVERTTKHVSSNGPEGSLPSATVSTTHDTRESEVTSGGAVDAIQTALRALRLSASARRAESAALGSFIVDEKIGGQDYRVFAQPIPLSVPIVSAESAAKYDRIYVVGLVTRKKLVGEMLATSATRVAILGILLVATVCSLPYLKLVLKGSQHHTRRFDLYILTYGGVGAIALVTLIVAHYWHHAAEARHLDGRLGEFGQTIRQSVRADIATRYRTLGEVFEPEQTPTAEAQESNSDYFSSIVAADESATRESIASSPTDVCKKSPVSAPDRIDGNQPYPAAELMFSADADGKVLTQVTRGLWAIPSAIRIGDRPYFKRAIAHDLPTVVTLFGRSSGRVQDTIVMPLPANADDSSEKSSCTPHIAVSVGDLTSLAWLALPVGFEFAVVDQDTGIVAHHSRAHWRGVENFFEAIGNDPRASALIQGAGEGLTDIVYHHERRRALILPLGPSNENIEENLSKDERDFLAKAL